MGILSVFVKTHWTLAVDGIAENFTMVKGAIYKREG
jgi:hypothetical protein